MNRRLSGPILIAALVAAACSAPQAPVAPPPPGDVAGWIGRPHAEWPHITLINRIEYHDASHPTAACGFLLETDHGVVAATAKHVLRFFKSESMDSVSFRDSLIEWRMSPKDDPTRITVLGRLINEDSGEPLEQVDTGEDWLLFEVAEPAEGVQRLRLREAPVEPGETVYVVGWRYPDQGPQRILEGRFVRSEPGSVLIDVPALTDNTLPGLSGSPVIDANGDVVGLMSQKAGKLQRLASVDYPLSVLRSRSASGPQPAEGSPHQQRIQQ